MKALNVILVDDDLLTESGDAYYALIEVQEEIQKYGGFCETISSSEELNHWSENNKDQVKSLDLAIFDYNLGSEGAGQKVYGTDLAKDLMSRFPHVSSVVLTGQGDDPDHSRIQSDEMQGYSFCGFWKKKDLQDDVESFIAKKFRDFDSEKFPNFNEAQIKKKLLNGGDRKVKHQQAVSSFVAEITAFCFNFEDKWFKLKPKSELLLRRLENQETLFKFLHKYEEDRGRVYEEGLTVDQISTGLYILESEEGKKIPQRIKTETVWKELSESTINLLFFEETKDLLGLGQVKDGKVDAKARYHGYFKTVLYTHLTDTSKNFSGGCPNPVPIVYSLFHHMKDKYPHTRIQLQRRLEDKIAHGTLIDYLLFEHANLPAIELKSVE